MVPVKLENIRSLEFLKEDIERLEVFLTGFCNSLGGTLKEAVSNTLIAGGKRLRPIIFLICAKTDGYDIDRLMPAAAAIEIIHTASLIHDDIIDKSALRRGRKTIHKKYDKDTAKFVGDYLFTHTFSLLNTYRDPDILMEMSFAAQNLVKGEFDQLKTKGDFQQDERIYLRKIDEKTASLFKVSCVLGGLLSGSSIKDIKNMRAFGKYLGYAFQINDDLMDLDYRRSVIEIGKPTGSDLRQGNVTLPLIYASREKYFRSGVKKLLLKEKIMEADIKEIIDLMNNTDAVEKTKDKLRSYLQKAKAVAGNISGDARQKGLKQVCRIIEEGVSSKGASN